MKTVASESNYAARAFQTRSRGSRGRHNAPLNAVHTRCYSDFIIVDTLRARCRRTRKTRDLEEKSTARAFPVAPLFTVSRLICTVTSTVKSCAITAIDFIMITFYFRREGRPIQRPRPIILGYISLFRAVSITLDPLATRFRGPIVLPKKFHSKNREC